jgi:N-acetyl-gamma-glutamyl-phosphate reductase
MKALVVGGSGYTGGELIRLLLSHDRIDDFEATSRTFEGKEISSVHRNLEKITNKKFTTFNKEKTNADVAFLALPHGESMQYAPKLLERGIKVVDLGADYRIKNQSLYEKYYVKHKSPKLLETAAYGLPELFRKDIKKAELTANPGCYATAAILSIAPITKAKGKFDLQRIVVDAKSGTSGAGAKPTKTVHHCEANNAMTPYKVVGHRHEPEINHILKRFAKDIDISFTPTLAPMTRGIISNAHIFGESNARYLKGIYEEFYNKEPFIRIVNEASTKNVAHTNYCDIAIYHEKRGRTVAISAIDNLVKGAAGQAVQNMNIMMGYEETTGLEHIPHHP